MASLRGNAEVVEYLLHHCHSDPLKKDKNNQLPLDIAAKKRHFKTEMCLRKYMYPNSLISFINSFGGFWQFWARKRVVSSLLVGYNDKELSRWPWRIVFASNATALILSLYFAIQPSMADLYWVHLTTISIYILWWICFVLCLFTSPGRVAETENMEDEQSRLIASGDVEGGSGHETAFLKALRDIAYSDETGNVVGDDIPSLCYTCHVRKPLRSKHCKISGYCIHKFDHFCPFVGMLSANLFAMCSLFLLL